MEDNNKIVGNSTGVKDVKPAPPIQIYNAGKTIHVNNPTGKNALVTVYRVDGTKVAEQTMATATALEMPVSGFYLVSVKAENEKPVTVKLMMQ